MQGQQRTTPCPSMLSSWWYTFLRYVTSIYVGMLFNVLYAHLLLFPRLQSSHVQQTVRVHRVTYIAVKRHVVDP